jgi:hypothetical protein
MKVKRLTPILNVSNIGESFAWFEKLGVLYREAVVAFSPTLPLGGYVGSTEETGTQPRWECDEPGTRYSG